METVQSLCGDIVIHFASINFVHVKTQLEPVECYETHGLATTNFEKSYEQIRLSSSWKHINYSFILLYKRALNISIPLLEFSKYQEILANAFYV